MAKKITIKNLKQSFRQDKAKTKQLFKQYQEAKGKKSKAIYGRDFRLGNIDKNTKEFYIRFLNYTDMITKLRKSVLKPKGRLIQLDPPIIHNVSKATETTYRVNVDDPAVLAKLIREKFIDEGVNQVKFSNEDKHASTKLKSKANLPENEIEYVIQTIAQSYYELNTTDMIITIITIPPIPKGGSSTELCPYLKDRSGFIQIQNDDNCCAQRCLVLSEISCDNRARYLPKNDKPPQRSLDTKLNKMCKGALGVQGFMNFTDFEYYKKLKCVLLVED